MLNIDSIVGSSTSQKKLPGTQSFAKNAERRAEQAKLLSIEANLKRLQAVDDLSYSQNNEESKNGTPTDSISEVTTGSKMDPITLARLVDECREEREQLQLMEVADDKSSQLTVYKQSELSMMQLAAVDQTSK